MDLSEFLRRFPQKMAEIQDFVKSDKLKDIVGTEAVNHYKESFENEGFTDKTLEKWPDVKRRDPESAWYGHSGQTGKFSHARTTAKILTGETNELANSIRYIYIPGGVRIGSPTAYAAVHQYGLMSKIYGRASFQQKPRPFINRSQVLEENINSKIVKEIKNIINK